MRTELYLLEKKAKSQPRQTAFSEAFIEACERKDAKDNAKRQTLQRRERRQDKRTAPALEGEE